MSPSTELRRLATEIREQAETRKTARQEKAAQILTAATGLALLRLKLGGRNA